jgi:hypothetical protein
MIDRLIPPFSSCQNDVTLCLGSHTFDSRFTELINEWHSHCDSRISFSASSPAASTLTTTYNTGACQSLYLSCARGDYETNQCSSSLMPASTTEYLSCVCQPRIYSLFSECMYNGNISCLATSAAESNILGYSICPYFRPGAVSFLLSRSFLSHTSDILSPIHKKVWQACSCMHPLQCSPPSHLSTSHPC